MSPAVLYRRLPGEGLDAFIAGFRKAAGHDPFGTVFIAPTASLAREVVRRLGEEGVPLVADAVTTLAGIARKIVSEHAARETLIPAAGSRLIIARLIAGGDYPLLSGAGAVDELAILFSVLTMRKVDYPAALGDLQGAKSAEIAALYRTYTRFLDEHRLIDESTLTARAIRLLSGDFRTVYVYGLFEPMPLERDLLLALRESAEEFFYAIPCAANPAVFADDGGWLYPDKIIEGKQTSAVAGLFSRGPPGDYRGLIRIAERRDRIDEVRAIAQEIRDLAAAGVRPGDIAVAFPDLDGAAPYVDEVFPDFGVPCTVSVGRPLSASPLVQALLSVLAAPARGYRRSDVIALVTSPYLPFTRGSELDILSREARIVAGTWDERLVALAANLDEQPEPEAARDRIAEKIAAIEAARITIRRLFADLATLEGAKTIPDHIAAYRLLLDTWQAPVMPGGEDPDLLDDEARDLAGFTRALAELEELARLLPGDKVPLSEFLSLLGILIAGSRAGRRRNRNTVRVIGIREVPHISVPYLFIAGLVEGEMPRLTTRLPFLTDAETRRLGTRSKDDILREERYHFIAALLAAQSRVYISYPAADGSTPLVRSGFVDAVREAFAPETWGNSDFPDSRLARAGRAGALLARGEAANPPGLTVREAVCRLNIENYHRKGGYDSPYDGLIGDDPAIAGRFGEEAVFSATALDTYADCPFRFSMEKVLGLAPLPPADPDLTAQERGNLVHRVACRFYAGWRRDGNGPVTEAGLPDALRRIQATGREEADRFTFTSPAWVAEKEHLLGSPAAGPGLLERFLRHDADMAASGLIPQAFEVSFGLPVSPGEVDLLSVPDAVAIPLGGETLRLRGRVDRVDVLPDGRFAITDYKTGSRHPVLKDIRAGKALQLPLYMRAVEILTGMQGVAGTYYTIRRGDVRNRPVFWDKAMKDCFGCFPGSQQSGVEDIRALVEGSLVRAGEYLAGIRGGRFPPRSDAGPCPVYCGFKTICRFDGLRLITAGGEVNADGTD
ncbi:MAG TPA: exodeoxyribonuclease V subunit gamma [Methanoculleus sp.]|nr:exodeoxyribonuclease V subunit gamma [Methanoculleus sp.]